MSSVSYYIKKNLQIVIHNLIFQPYKMFGQNLLFQHNIKWARVIKFGYITFKYF